MNKCIISFAQDNRTALHYASEGGRGKILKMLLQFGANIGLRDGIKHKTALELGSSERIKEIIIVYSSAPFKTNEKDMVYLDQAIKGAKAKVHETAPYVPAPSLRSRQSDYKYPARESPNNEAYRDTETQNENQFLPYNFKDYQDKLMFLLKRVQNTGAESHQHIKKPYLFSGSWMETVVRLEDLFNKLESISSTEAVMR